jgi:hypothetical protein
MRGWFVLVGVGISWLSYAQDWPFELWHEGKVVLETGDTLKGAIKYDFQNDLLQLNQNGKVEAYTARKVLFYEIFDATVKRYRQVYSLPYSRTGGYKAPIFFELLEEGKITLLAREALEYRTVSSPYFFYSNYTRLVLVYKYFLMRDNGSIIEIENPKKGDWLQLMGNYADEVQRYAKTNKLEFDEKYDLVRIIAYYNSLFK